MGQETSLLSLQKGTPGYSGKLYYGILELEHIQLWSILNYFKIHTQCMKVEKCGLWCFVWKPPLPWGSSSSPEMLRDEL